MIDFLRDSSACPVFCKILPFSGLNGGMFEMFHMSCTHKSFSTSQKSIKLAVQLKQEYRDGTDRFNNEQYAISLKPGLHIVRRIIIMCLRPFPKEHITAPQVSIAKISCERLLLSKTCITM